MGMKRIKLQIIIGSALAGSHHSLLLLDTAHDDSDAIWQGDILLFSSVQGYKHLGYGGCLDCTALPVVVYERHSNYEKRQNDVHGSSSIWFDTK